MMQKVSEEDPCVLLVGYGRWGRNYARELANRGVLCGIIDPSVNDPNDDGQTEPNGAPVFDSISSGLKKVKATHAVVATPAHLHFQHAYELITHGINVLLEKPATQTTTELEDLYSLADENKVRLLIGHLMRHHPAVEAIAKMLHKGLPGRPVKIVSQRMSFGAIRSDEGVLESLGTHDISIILEILGDSAGEVDVVSRVGTSTEDGLENWANVHLRFFSGDEAIILLNRLSLVKRQEINILGPLATVTFDDVRTSEEGKILAVTYDVSSQSEIASSVLGLSSQEINLDFTPDLPLGRQIDYFLDSEICVDREERDKHIALKIAKLVEKLRYD